MFTSQTKMNYSFNLIVKWFGLTDWSASVTLSKPLVNSTFGKLNIPFTASEVPNQDCLNSGGVALNQQMLWTSDNHSAELSSQIITLRNGLHVRITTRLPPG